MIFYSQYVAWLTSEYANFQIDPSFREIGPLHRPTVAPNSAPWSMDWALLFPDGRYAYVYERWHITGLALPGHPRRGKREHFSFHYGPTSASFKPNGIPERDKLNCPAVIRIDCDKRGPHLHFHGETDHIKQSRIDGMLIEKADPFAFMRAVLKHRESGVDFDEIFKFKVKP